MTNPIGNYGYGGYNFPKELFRSQSGELAALLQSVNIDANNAANGIGPLGTPNPNDYLWQFSQGLSNMTQEAAYNAARVMGQPLPQNGPGLDPRYTQQPGHEQPGAHATESHTEAPAQKTLFDRALGGLAGGLAVGGTTALITAGLSTAGLTLAGLGAAIVGWPVAIAAGAGAVLGMLW